MRKRPAKRDFLKGYKVIIKQHAVDRYMERAGVSESEARNTLEKKFRNSVLSSFKPDGAELRREVVGAKDKKLNFIAYKYNKTFVVVTCFLQGSKDNWWKNEGIIEEKPKDISYDEITEDIKHYFQEVSG